MIVINLNFNIFDVSTEQENKLIDFLTDCYSHKILILKTVI